MSTCRLEEEIRKQDRNMREKSMCENNLFSITFLQQKREIGIHV